MNKKKIVCGVLASAIALSVTLSGCDSLIAKNNVADMKQTIATVNISKADDFEKEGLDAYKDAVGTTSISKRELISYFLNVGYSYINSGASYEAVFNLLVDQLANNAVLTQYAVMYLLKEKETDEKDPKTAEQIMEEYNSKTTLSAKYEYVLGEDSVEVKLAEYALRVAVNGAIDSYEKKYLDDDDDDTSGSGTRAVPKGVDTEQDKFYPAKDEDDGIDYNIYTGYKDYELTNSGVYEKDKLKGTNENTRKKAYNDFLSSVNSYNLIDVRNENMKDTRNLRYIEDEYVKQLEQRIRSKYYEVYESKQESDLKDEGKYDYIDKAYQDALKKQNDSYKADGFTSTLDSMSDSSFILYVPETEGHGVYDEVENGKFGFVYNILLPFNAYQSTKLTEYQSLYSDKDEDSGYTMDYFIKRNELLRGIKTTDQRAAWFNGTTEYAFNASENSSLKYFGASDWLFFENNLVQSDKYEKLEKYAGQYSYNGTVVKKDDGYVLIPNELTIDGMLKEFSNYIDFVLDGEVTGNNVKFDSGYTLEQENSSYYGTEDFYKAEQEKEDGTKLDYAKFLYAYGHVDNINKTIADLYDKTSAQYKVLSAVNELQYAYTTDTGVLSNYVGYSVNAADTNYIKEFEYAAQKVINEKGVGGFAVCAGDYGWHLIYVTCALEAGEQFTPDWEKNIDVEGSFENLFYEMVKEKKISESESDRQSAILTQFNIGKTVKKYKKAYQDLLDLG